MYVCMHVCVCVCVYVMLPGNGGATCDDEDKDAGDSCKRVSYLDQSRRQVQRAEKAMKDAVDFLNK